MSERLTLRHRLWRLLPATRRRRWLTWASSLAAPKIARLPPQAQGGVIIAGEFTRASGLGVSARLTLRALETLGVPAWPIDIGPLLPAHVSDLPPPAGPASAPPPRAALLVHVNAPWLPAVLTSLPRALTRDRRVVGLWAWELPVASPDWQTGARFVHDVWAPSHFAAKALAPLAPGRVHVVLPPHATEPLCPSGLSRADFGFADGVLVVLVSFSLASSFERKNPLAAIAAFRAAFGARTDRLLVLKVGNPGHFPNDFARLTAAVGGAPNIRIETRTLPSEDSLALTASADIVMSLHRSEGFGLVPAEAMLLGRPVIATGWSGNMEFMDNTTAALIRYRLIPARDARGVYEVPGAVWAEPDVTHAAEWLRRLADDAPLRHSLGRAGNAMATSRLGTESLANAVQALGIEIQAQGNQ